MPSTTRRILPTALGAAILLSACSSGDDDASPSTTDAPVTTPVPDTTAATTTTAGAPTTTVPPATTAATTAPPTVPTTTPVATTTTTPPTTNPGDPNWIEITQSLVELQHELRANPDVDRIEEFCVGGESNCQAVQGEEIRRLAEEGWRVIGAPLPKVVSARLVSTADDAPVAEALWALVEVETLRQDQTGAAIVDADDNVVFDLANSSDSPTIVANFLLAGSTAGGWRVLAIDQLENE